MRITITADITDRAAALAELARANAAGELKAGGVYALVGGQRLEPEGAETPEAFAHRVRATVTEQRAGFAIRVGGG